MNVLSFYVFSNIKISHYNHMSDILGKKNLDTIMCSALDFPMKFKQITILNLIFLGNIILFVLY